MLFENIIIYTDLGPGTLVCKLAPHSSRARSQGEQVFFSQKVHLEQSSSKNTFPFPQSRTLSFYHEKSVIHGVSTYFNRVIAKRLGA